MRTRESSPHHSRLVVAALLAILGLTVQAAVVGRDGRIKVTIEAHPSSDCFPLSSLQQSELEQDFTAVCPECIVLLPRGKRADYHIIVEDPEFGWFITVLDRKGKRIARFSWNGSLDYGLELAARIVRNR